MIGSLAAHLGKKENDESNQHLIQHVICLAAEKKQPWFLDNTIFPHSLISDRGRKASEATPYTYAQTVVSHSLRRKENSLFPGINYKPFADYLSRSSTNDFIVAGRGTGNYHLDGLRDGHIFASLQDYLFSAEHSSNQSDICRTYDFDSALPGQEALARQNENLSSSAQLLFLRGFPSPEWLRLIGCSYRVDPEFFRRHLDFLRPEEGHFDLPNLPSVSKNIVKIPLMTIGTRNFRDSSAWGEFGDLLEPERRRAFASVRTHLSQMAKAARVGQSIIRKFLIFDEQYFAIEQEVSICVQSRREGWTGVILLDCGRDIKELANESSPWLKGSSQAFTSPSMLPNTCIPVYQFKPKMALKGQSLDGKLDTDNHSEAASNTYQSASSLYKHYGRTLDQDALKMDAFYAFTELFAFSAFSESQFLNMVEQTVTRSRETLHTSFLSPPQPRSMQSTLEMLQFAKYVADDHIQRLHGTISCIKSKGGPTWPRTTDTKHKEIADTAASQLLEDYEELLQRAQRLSQRCADQTSLLLNNSMLAQSKRNIWQAERVARLTLLAFLFIPLSFTASIFGMNVMELENGDGPRLSIWVWVVVSVPTFVVAFLVCFWDSVWGYLKMILSHALHGK
ncbi:hypothetical protein N7522_009686 [Penicillium canescens]|nr:hypothetical protein N7522_009686 [Penicillium canescens]